MTADAASKLNAKAAQFANQMTALTRGVLGEDSPRFHAVNMGSRIRVAPIDDQEVVQRIPIHIDGVRRLSLLVRYYCCWDGAAQFLAADASDIHLFYEGSTDPLMRLEYVRKDREPPGAHLHVHAHRDEVAFLLRLSEKGRPARKMLGKKPIPRLAEMHLPVGGHRMRPALEDMLLLLHREFAIDVVDGWEGAIREHLEDWRRLQLRSAVRDAPEEAIKVLRSLGYSVEPPRVAAPRPSPESAKLYWP
ncbi:hypothetical protein ACTWP5_27770 [Streptomyces sp. 4N509B]|uniref:hypothetical protein n=1 Tax=Streptomyces sp. 4N509B TaxID=3457413 RepID=UPI003FD35576